MSSEYTRLQNSPYFCVFKYARAVKQKVWNEAENRERDWGETLKIWIIIVIIRAKIWFLYGERLLAIIIHSKYFSDSDWLKAHV